MRWPNRWWWSALIVASVVAAVSGTFWFVVGIAFGMLIAYIDASSSRKRR